MFFLASTDLTASCYTFRKKSMTVEANLQSYANRARVSIKHQESWK